MTESRTEAPPDNPEDFPGVDLAYEFVRPAYEAAERRFSAMDNRIQALLSFAAALTVAGILLGGTLVDDIDFDHPSLFLAIGTFAITAIIGVRYLAAGKLRAISPNRLYAMWLEKDEWTFKKNMVAFAGEDFDVNIRTIEWKGRAADWMGFLLGVETVLLVFWIAASRQGWW